MTTKIARIALILFAAGLAASAAHTGENTGKAAESVRDDAISKLVAWRTKSADSLLKKKATYESTQPYLTAEALLMATYSLNRDDETVKRALRILEKQSQKDAKDPVAEFFRGEVLRWLDRSDEAKKAWQNAKDRAAAAVKADSKNATARYYLGASMVRLKQPDEARKALKKAAKGGFNETMVDFQLGLTFALQEKWGSAKAAFDDVHEFDPRYAHLYFYRGLASDKLGRKDQLLDDFDQFVKLAPNSPEASTAKTVLAAMQ